uniref:Uncharacterized protein n=1 Tax=Pseudoalteromonas citrea DSM 8771 TaxID=1117314 RepID=U1JVR7_9GAMM
MDPDLRQGDDGVGVKIGVNWHGPWPSSGRRFGGGVMRQLKSLVRPHFRLPEFISGSRFCVAFLAQEVNWHGP